MALDKLMKIIGLTDAAADVVTTTQGDPELCKIAKDTRKILTGLVNHKRRTWKRYGWRLGLKAPYECLYKGNIIAFVGTNWKQKQDREDNFDIEENSKGFFNGYYERAKAILESKAFKDILDKMSKKKEIIIGGFSLGGAVVQNIANLMSNEEMLGKQFYAIGSPRVAKDNKKKINNVFVVNYELDEIPLYPNLFASNIGKEYQIGVDGKLRAVGRLRKIWRAIKRWFKYDPKCHSEEFYLDRVKILGG